MVACKKRFISCELVILVELGYISFDKEGLELLFNLLSNRSERTSTVFTTNMPFDKWVPLFEDTMMATMIDKIANKDNVIQIIGKSYRIKQTQEWMRKES